MFLARQPPLSRLKLDQRLRVLDPEDANTLRLVEDALQWDRLPMAMTEEGVAVRVRKALEGIDNEVLQQIICDRLELRSCVAALRRRHSGEGPPAASTGPRALSPEMRAKVLARVGDREITLGQYAATLERMNEFDVYWIGTEPKATDRPRTSSTGVTAESSPRAPFQVGWRMTSATE